ncbi:hypothetical protein [Terrabacter sp. 2RAF25]|uniref:hypothetical protein n=1 Tax=Terrabacter sp. 2RAF25 TaxID=3232998 RepID=UPI003F9CD999
MTHHDSQPIARILHRALFTIAAVGTLAVPGASAVASPAPDPPPRPQTSTVTVPEAVDGLLQAYRSAPLAQKLGIHEEILLAVATGMPAL